MENNRQPSGEAPVLNYRTPEPQPLPAEQPVNWRRVRWGFWIVILAGLLAVYLILPQLGASHERRYRSQCARNLRAIHAAITLYVSEHRAYPPDLASVMLNADAAAEVFVCPSSNQEAARGQTLAERARLLSDPLHCSYIYLGATLVPAATTSDALLVVEKIANHERAGMNVLHASGRVRWVDAGPELDVILMQTGQ